MYLAHERRSRILSFLSLIRKEWEVAQAEEARLQELSEHLSSTGRHNILSAGKLCPDSGAGCVLRWCLTSDIGLWPL